jgi:alanyl-tRNA synthetase
VFQIKTLGDFFVMTSADIRQSFLDFFKSKEHEIVPSASLMPSSPNLLFTNSGMNQFVPYFLGDRKAPYGRAADTQKCIRAGGKHNDLEDVGFDTYHHTFFEMLGNWSFGNYFKKEAIEWAWELLVDVWKFPKERLYVTVYKPSAGDPADFDTEAHSYWKAILERAGLDPAVHIVSGNRKDNFWMMGETGPCGPCSEIHIDLTLKGDTRGNLVNKGSPFCIEIWNLVFIQFNATEDGQFVPLKDKHVDTGMGFERVAGILATTKNFTDFSSAPSNYNCDLFKPLFDRITEMCGHTYGATLPEDRDHMTESEMKDTAFRVLADHIRTLSCSIADGILPGNEGRNYVLRRILRRAILFGRRLNLPAGFFRELVDPVVSVLGPVFPELVAQKAVIRRVIESEENAFDRTIDRGLQLLEKIFESKPSKIEGADAFQLYDTFGFPLDLTQLIAAERGLTVDTDGFNVEMEKQRQRARAAHKSTVITVNDEAAEGTATRFVGFDPNALTAHPATILSILQDNEKAYVITDSTPFYAEMGGQLGDQGTIEAGSKSYQILQTLKNPQGQFLHEVSKIDAEQLQQGASVTLNVALKRRQQIQRHHTATHILHWALRKVLGTHVRQAGSLVTEERLRFDFAHFAAVTPEELRTIERLANERILANDSVRWYEVDFDQKPENVIAFFGEKYGNRVRVVDMGGWSLELCGGTHTQATGELGLLKVIAESAIAAGTRRIEAVSGDAALKWAEHQSELLQSVSRCLSCKVDDVESRLISQQERLQTLEQELRQLKAKGNADLATQLIDAKQPLSQPDLCLIAATVDVDDANALRELTAKTLHQMGAGVVFLAANIGEKSSLVAICSPEAVKAGYHAGKMIQELAGKLQGKGGGKPDFAMGGGKASTELASFITAFASQNCTKV